jgi:hypothetical protein
MPEVRITGVGLTGAQDAHISFNVYFYQRSKNVSLILSVNSVVAAEIHYPTNW